MDLFISIYLTVFFFGFFFLMIFLILHYRYRHELNDFPKATRYPSITFLVPAYNEEDTLEGTIRSLIKVEYPKDKKKIIIINDGSKDKTLEIAKKLEEEFEEVSVLNKLNSGKANSLNEALKLVKTELIAVTDADSYPNPDSVKKMVGHFGDEKVCAVTSRVLVKNKRNLLERFQVMDYSIIAWTRKLLDFVDSVYVTNGPLSIYRADKVKEIGGFDPTNLTEDIEITWHFLSLGYKTRMSYSAIVYTNVPSRIKQWINQRVRWNLGGIQTIRKYYKSMFKNPEHVFGYFVIPYVASSFFLAMVGFLLFLRYLWLKGTYYLFSLVYLFKDYYFYRYFNFNFNLTLLITFAALFLVLSIFYYKIGFKRSETGNKSILKIFAYSFVYRSLYIIPLILALYKLAKGDLGWYTK